MAALRNGFAAEVPFPWWRGLSSVPGLQWRGARRWRRRRWLNAYPVVLSAPHHLRYQTASCHSSKDKNNPLLKAGPSDHNKVKVSGSRGLPREASAERFKRQASLVTLYQAVCEVHCTATSDRKERNAEQTWNCQGAAYIPFCPNGHILCCLFHGEEEGPGIMKISDILQQFVENYSKRGWRDRQG